MRAMSLEAKTSKQVAPPPQPASQTVQAQVDLLTVIADSLKPLQELVEINREIASTLRRLESSSSLVSAPVHPTHAGLKGALHKHGPVLDLHPDITGHPPKSEAVQNKWISLLERNSRSKVQKKQENENQVLLSSNVANEPSSAIGKAENSLAVTASSKQDDVGCKISVTKATHHEAFCRFNIFNVEELDLLTSSVNLTFYFEVTWEMPELLKDGVLVDPKHVDWEQVWQPTITFANKNGDLQIHSWNAIDAGYFEKFGKPMASWRAKVAGSFFQTWNLRKFPYDEQAVEIVISTDHCTTQCNLVRNDIVPSHAQVSKFSIAEQFTLQFDAENPEEMEPRKGAGGQYSQLRLVVKARRKPTFVLSNYVMMMFLLVTAFVLSMLPIDPMELSDRLQVSSNFVLTGMAVKLLSSDQLPDLPYLTYLDKYLIASICLIIAFVAQEVICFFVVPEEHAKLVDKIFLLSVGGLWLFMHSPILFKKDDNLARSL